MAIEITGVELDNPVLLASGILGSTGESLNRAIRNGAGGVVTKSMGPRPREGHPGPNVYSEDGYTLNAVGLSNPSREFISELEKVRGPAIASIYGSNGSEFADLARHFEPEADAVELNISCPHADGYGTDIGADPKLTEQVTSAVCNAVDIPVWVKLTPNVADISMIGCAAERAGADALTAVNTLGAMAIDIESERPILGNIEGGLACRGEVCF